MSKGIEGILRCRKTQVKREENGKSSSGWLRQARETEEMEEAAVPLLNAKRKGNLWTPVGEMPMMFTSWQALT